jgi:hypothetical protein
MPALGHQRRSALITSPTNVCFTPKASELPPGHENDAKCHNWIHAPQQNGFLFDDLVSELLELQRHVDAKRICCF